MAFDFMNAPVWKRVEFRKVSIHKKSTENPQRIVRVQTGRSVCTIFVPAGPTAWDFETSTSWTPYHPAAWSQSKICNCSQIVQKNGDARPWCRCEGMSFKQRFGSGSGSTQIHCIWPDPDPGKEIEVDPDPEPDPRRGLKWIRIRIRSNAVDPGGSGSGSETLLPTDRKDLEKRK